MGFSYVLGPKSGPILDPFLAQKGVQKDALFDPFFDPFFWAKNGPKSGQNPVGEATYQIDPFLGLLGQNGQKGSKRGSIFDPLFWHFLPFFGPPGPIFGPLFGPIWARH